MKTRMPNAKNPSLSSLLTALLVAVLATPALSAQETESKKSKSIIRVISTADGEQEENNFFFMGDGDSSANSWVSLPFKRAYLGVQLVDLTPDLRAHFGVPEEAGAMVAEVAKGSPAEAAGLAVGDIVTRIEGREMQTGFDVARAVSKHEEGDEVTIESWRDGKVRSHTATLAVRERTTVDVGQLVGPGTRLEKRVLIEPGLLPERVLEIDKEGLHEALRDFELRFEDPEFREKFTMLGRDRVDLQERIKELEKRLKDLEKQLDKLPKE